MILKTIVRRQSVLSVIYISSFIYYSKMQLNIKFISLLIYLKLMLHLFFLFLKASLKSNSSVYKFPTYFLSFFQISELNNGHVIVCPGPLSLCSLILRLTDPSDIEAGCHWGRVMYLLVLSPERNLICGPLSVLAKASRTSSRNSRCLSNSYPEPTRDNMP